jgi:hypothetical protein
VRGVEQHALETIDEQCSREHGKALGVEGLLKIRADQADNIERALIRLCASRLTR